MLLSCLLVEVDVKKSEARLDLFFFFVKNSCLQSLITCVRIPLLRLALSYSVNPLCLSLIKVSVSS